MNENLSGWKKWVVGIGIIIAAVAGYLWKALDNDPTTVPDNKAAVEEIKRGVDVLRTEEAKPVAAPAPAEK